MAKKRKRKIFLSSILGLSIRCSRVNADLFVEGLSLPPVFSSKPGISRPIPRCGRSNGIISRLAASAGSNIQNNDNRLSKSYFESSLNTIFEWKQLQRKFKHAPDFGVMGNYNLNNRDLYRKKLIEHMKSNHACLGTYRGNPVYHYYNPDNNLNVMVNRNNNKFISGWRLNDEQIKNMERNGNIQ